VGTILRYGLPFQFFNVNAWFDKNGNRRKTAEIRLHTAALNGDKVCNWVVAHVKFVEWCAKMGADYLRATLEGASAESIFQTLANVWNDAELTEYYRGRAAKFGTHYGASAAA
jgi:hypothetical protein